VSRTTASSRPVPRLRIDIDKMFRFAQWLFNAEAHAEIRSEDQPNDADSDGQCAA